MQHFHVELAAIPPAKRDDLVAGVATLTSFDASDQMCHVHDRGQQQVRRAWVTALQRMLGAQTGR